MKNKGITLIALVVTIIILLILAGVTIGFAMNGTSLFDKAKLATDEYNNKVQQEETEFRKITKEIDYIANSRNTDSIYKSLINTNDNIYSKTDSGYVFTLGNYNTYSTNNRIQLTESIENFDFVLFLVDLYLATGSKYWAQKTIQFDVDQIKNHYNDPSYYVLCNSVADGNIRIIGTFENNSTFVVDQGWTSSSSYTQFRIIDIKGLKY